jgi:hypothetical protein
MVSIRVHNVRIYMSYIKLTLDKQVEGAYNEPVVVAKASGSDGFLAMFARQLCSCHFVWAVMCILFAMIAI